MKKSLLKLGIVLLLFVSACACEDDDVTYESCGDLVIISETDYEAEPSSLFTILDASIDDDCLLVKVSASGCDGDSWYGEFFTTEPEPDNGIIWFYGRMEVTNTEACQAVITKDFYFDLTRLQVSSTGSVNLEIDGLDETLVYTY